MKIDLKNAVSSQYMYDNSFWRIGCIWWFCLPILWSMLPSLHRKSLIMRRRECVNGNASMGLKQHVNVPTHVSGHTLDLMITREHDPVISSVPVADRYLSDHASVLCSLNNAKPGCCKDYSLSSTQGNWFWCFTPGCWKIRTLHKRIQWP